MRAHIRAQRTKIDALLSLLFAPRLLDKRPPSCKSASRPSKCAIFARWSNSSKRYSVKEWGRKTADKCLDDIATALDHLSVHPETLRLEPDFSPGLYFYRVKKHFLVCDYQRETVVVLTVIHTSMDLPARLLELEPRLIAESQFLQCKLHNKPGPG